MKLVMLGLAAVCIAFVIAALVAGRPSTAAVFGLIAASQILNWYITP